MNPLWDLLTAYVIQMFILVDPVGCVPVFITITRRETPEQRRRMALRGSVVAALVIVFFLCFGPSVTGYFGIGTAAVQVCGGVLLFVIALEMIYGKTSRTSVSDREEHLAEAKEDVSITPLAVPILAGPGAIANALLFAQRASGLLELAALVAGTAAVFAVTWGLLRHSERITRRLGDLGIVILTRILGLILAFLATQYVLSGIQTLLGRG